MKYIKVRFNLLSPASEEFESYGWDTVWTKRAQILGTEPIEPGQIVSFQPVTVRRDGKCLIVSTKRNIIALRAMKAAGQITLGPGETLELEGDAPAAAPKPVDEWPAEPGTETEKDDVEVVEEVEVIPVAPKKRPKATLENLTPDKE